MTWVKYSVQANSGGKETAHESTGVKRLYNVSQMGKSKQSIAGVRCVSDGG